MVEVPIVPKHVSRMASLKDAEAVIKEGKSTIWGQLPDFPHKTDKFGLGFTAAGQKAMRWKTTRQDHSPRNQCCRRWRWREPLWRLDLSDRRRGFEQLGSKGFCSYHLYQPVILSLNNFPFLWSVITKTICTLFSPHALPGACRSICKGLISFIIICHVLMNHWTFSSINYCVHFLSFHILFCLMMAIPYTHPHSQMQVPIHSGFHGWLFCFSLR